MAAVTQVRILVTALIIFLCFFLVLFALASQLHSKYIQIIIKNIFYYYHLLFVKYCYWVAVVINIFYLTWLPYASSFRAIGDFLARFLRVSLLPVPLMHQSIPGAPIPPPRDSPRALAGFLVWMAKSRGCMGKCAPP